MQSISLSVCCLLAAIALIGSLRGYRSGVFRGVGLVAVGSLLIPTWHRIPGVDVDLRVFLAVGAAGAATVFRPRWLFDRLVLTDVVVAFLCVWQTLSEWHATGRVVEPFFLSYGIWALPYVVGRCSARSLDDLRYLGRCLTVVAIFLAVVSLVETFGSVDLFQMVFGEKPGLQFHPGKMKRWGFVRCEGPYTHPIFFGTVLMLIVPWSVWMLLTNTGRSRSFAAFGVVSTIAATVSSVSRGPVLGVLVSLMVASVIRYRKLLFTLIVTAGLLAGFLVTRPDYLESATLWFARISGERETSVLINDEEQVRTSSMTRILLIQHYWKSVRHAGVIGYGITATETFPPNVPHVPFDQMSGKLYPVIDNTYVLLTLRAGWLQCLGFVLLHLATLHQLSSLAKHDPLLVSFSRLLSGAICAHALVVFTVYPDYDFMFVFMWTVGISSVGLSVDSRDGMLPAGRV